MRSHTVDATLSHTRPVAPILFVGLLLVVGMIACDGAGPPGRTAPEASSVSLSVSAEGGGGTGATQVHAKGGPSNRVFTDPSGNSLRLDRVELILHSIEFARGPEDCAAEADGDCEELEAGPRLMGLPLESDRPSVVVDTTLPVGAWEEATFEVEEASDASVLEGTNFPPDASIRAQGSFTPAGGTEQSFTYITELDAEREIEFEPPIEVTNEEPSNVTFSVDVNAWFRTADSTLVNPAQATADRPFQDLVEENIERSIEGFEDDDRDGEEDENEDEDESDNGEEEEEGDDDEDDEDDENEEDEEEKEIEVDLKTSGPDPDASGEAEFEQEPDRTEFKVEVEDLSPGTYEVVVADTTRGQIDVGEGDDDTDGELEFRTPSEAGHPLLDFDPRGKRVAVTQGETVYLEADFPSTEDHD